MTVLAIEDRRAWERALIERYRDTVSEHSGTALSVDDAWDAYRAQACLALLMWTPTLCPPPTLPDMQPEATSLEMIRRNHHRHGTITTCCLRRNRWRRQNGRTTRPRIRPWERAVVQAIVLKCRGSFRRRTRPWTPCR